MGNLIIDHQLRRDPIDIQRQVQVQVQVILHSKV
jgi:hypothetical protein